MSKQYNKTIFIGHLGGEPEMRFTPSGTPVTIFNVATHDQYPNEKGEIIKVTTDLPPKNRSKTNVRIGSTWRQKLWQKERNIHQNRLS